VSLVPSDTDTLFALGLGERIVGRTRYCVEPEGRVESIEVVGGTKDIDADAVAALAPDLVIANQEENSRSPLEAIAKRGIPLYISFPQRVADGIAHVATLARAFEVDREPAVVELMKKGYQVLQPLTGQRTQKPSVFVPIWMDPLMTFADHTFASDMLEMIGAVNAFADRERKYPLGADLGQRAAWPAERVSDRDTRYPRITLEEVEERKPDIVLLPDEPHEFTEDDAEVFRAQSTPAAERGAVRLCDGKDLFWYGARSIAAVPRLRTLIAELSRAVA